MYSLLERMTDPRAFQAQSKLSRAFLISVSVGLIGSLLSNCGGSGSSGSAATPGATKPTAPSNVSLVAGNSQVTISWTAVSDATSYNVYWGTATTETKATHDHAQTATTSPAIVTGLANGTTYYFTVTATNANGESTESLVASSTPAATGTTYYVSAISGSDANAGTLASPFKTIAHGVSVAVSGDTVQVSPGTYDTAGNGETFPISIPAGVLLIGDEAHKGVGMTPTLINSAGTSTLGVGGGATVAGFKITAGGTVTTPNAMSLTSGSGSIVRNNTCVKTNGTCIAIGTSSNHIITGNVIGNTVDVYPSGTSNSYGITAGAGGSGVTGVRVENNAITHNGFGVEMDGLGSVHSTMDLGGGATGSAGGNTFSCNSQADVYLSDSGQTYYARNNSWDHATPTVGNFGTGIDIYNGGTGTSLTTPNNVDITGSAAVASPCP